jgi:hypothetical protein
MNFTEKIVVAALLLPLALCVRGSAVWINCWRAFVRAYWLPIDYVLPVHIGVVIAVVFLLPISVFNFVKWVSKRKRK